jgi:zinc protease
MITRSCLAAVLGAASALAQTSTPPSQASAAASRPPSARPVAGRGAAALPYKDLKFPAGRPLETPQPVRFQLANGMKVLLLQDGERPIVSVEALVRTGSLFEPADRAGLASMTGNLLRSGGAGMKPPERLDADLDNLGATVESAIGDAAGVVSLSVLKENLPAALALFRDILTAPDFRHDRVDRAKTIAFATVAGRNEDPGPALFREFRTVVFGKDSPANRRPEFATLAKIGRPDVVAFYRRYFFPANVTLLVSGDFDATAMKGAIESLFVGWKNDQPPVPEFPKIAATPAPGSFVGQLPALKETSFAVGVPIAEGSVQEGAALRVAAALLGGSIHGRLMQRSRAEFRQVREIRADWLDPAGRPGIFLITGVCQSPSAADVLQAAVEEVKRLGTAEASEDEFRAARELALTRLLSGLDNRAHALFARAQAEYYGYPAEYRPSLYTAGAAVTRTYLVRLANERLQPENLTIVGLSNLVAWTKPIDPRGGATKKLDLTIPQAALETISTRPASEEIAKKILGRAQEASGGLEKLMAVTDFIQTAQYDVVTGGYESQTDRWLAPSHLRQDAQVKIGPVYRYTDGVAGWMSNGRASTALTGRDAREAQAEVLRLYLRALISDHLPERTIAALDDDTVEISKGDARIQMVFDATTGLPSKLLYDVNRVPPVMVEETYSDFRDVNGIRVPFGITVTQNGTKYSTGTITEFKINQGLKVEVLQRRP